MKIYMEFLAHSRCLLVCLFLLFSLVVSGRCAERTQFIIYALNDDSGMLIFIQINILHETICVY